MNKERLFDMLPELDEQAKINFGILIEFDSHIKNFYNTFCDRDIKLSNALDDLEEIICENIKLGSISRSAKYYDNALSTNKDQGNHRNQKLDNGGFV